MSECLITTLKESVTDNTLLKLGEMAFYITDKEDTITSVAFNVKSGDEIQLQIVGDGYFTDSTGASNLGKNMTITYNSSNTVVYFSKGNYKVLIKNKYDISYFINTLNNLGTKNVIVDINDFLGCSKLSSIAFNRLSSVTGDLSFAVGNTNLFRCDIYDATKVTGDIASFLDNVCYYVSLENCTNIYGDISVFTGKRVNTMHFNGSSKIKGDLSSISGCTTLQQLWFHGCPEITGELTDLANLTNLQSLTLNDTQVTGDTSDLAGLTNLTTFWYTNTAITGTWPLS